MFCTAHGLLCYAARSDLVMCKHTHTVWSLSTVQCRTIVIKASSLLPRVPISQDEITGARSIFFCRSMLAIFFFIAISFGLIPLCGINTCLQLHAMAKFMTCTWTWTCTSSTCIVSTSLSHSSPIKMSYYYCPKLHFQINSLFFMSLFSVNLSVLWWWSVERTFRNKKNCIIMGLLLPTSCAIVVW